MSVSKVFALGLDGATCDLILLRARKLQVCSSVVQGPSDSPCPIDG
jgi:hypothetical protein